LLVFIQRPRPTLAANNPHCPASLGSRVFLNARQKPNVMQNRLSAARNYRADDAVFAFAQLRNDNRRDAIPIVNNPQKGLPAKQVGLDF